MKKNVSTSITLIKLGGSVITNKEVPMTVREEVLQRLLKEIAQIRKDQPEQLIILGHGQGSFAHVPAMRYKTMDGFVHPDSQFGMAVTQDSAARMNRVVVEACLAEELPALTFAFSNSLVTKKGQLQHFCGEVLSEYLSHGMLPVVFGDVIADSQQGCTIWSTEVIFGQLVEWLGQQPNYQVAQVIHVGEVAGVLDDTGQVIEKITPSSFAELKKHFTQTKGFDVTGGMMHKVEESLALTQHGIETIILSGLMAGNLHQAVTNGDWVGTKITLD